MKNSELEQIVKNSRDLPSLPIVAIRLLKLMKTPDCSARDVTNVIAHDQALASQVLRVANSAFYGFSHQVTTLSHAVALLGNYTIQNLALGISMVRDLANVDLLPLNAKRFWGYAYECGLRSQLIAKRVLPDSASEEMMVAGLLHDIGYLLITRSFKQQFFRVITEFEENLSPVQGNRQQQVWPMSTFEKEILGFTHAEIGAALMEHWKFPEIFQTIARYHDDPRIAPNRKDRKTAAVVSLAEKLQPLERAVLSMDLETVLPADTLKTLRMEPQDCEELENRMENMGDSAKELFNA